MKIIKITTENEITTLEFPEGDITSVNKRLYEMIGPKCELMEHVMPSRLYKILGASNRPKKEKGSCTSILMDEEAYYHDLEVNVVGSWLYESDLHGNPILETFWSLENTGVEMELNSAECQMNNTTYYIHNLKNLRRKRGNTDENITYCRLAHWFI